MERTVLLMGNINRRAAIKSFFIGGLTPLYARWDFLKKYEDYKYIEAVKNNIHSKVVSYTDPLCVTAQFKINEQRARTLFQKALMEYTGKSTIGEAAKSLFPKFRTDLRVAIKVNTASTYMPSHQCLAYAIAHSLIGAGLKPENIIIWERTEKTLMESGYVIRNEPEKIKVIGTDSTGYGYDQEKKEKVHKVPVYVTSILTKHADYQINLGVLKHHWFTGVATCLKNHYGSIPLFDNVRLTGIRNLIRLHLNACDPYISELNHLMEDKAPTVLNVCDGLLGIYNSGPLGPPQWVQNELLLSSDPVAIDTLSFYRIEQKRKEVGLPPLLNKAMFLKTSAHSGLGTNNPEQMEIIKKVVGQDG